MMEIHPDIKAYQKPGRFLNKIPARSKDQPSKYIEANQRRDENMDQSNWNEEKQGRKRRLNPAQQGIMGEGDKKSEKTTKLNNRERDWRHKRLFSGDEAKHLMYPDNSSKFQLGEEDLLDSIMLLNPRSYVRNVQKVPHLHRWNKQISSIQFALEPLTLIPAVFDETEYYDYESEEPKKFGKRTYKKKIIICPITGRILYEDRVKDVNM